MSDKQQIITNVLIVLFLLLTPVWVILYCEFLSLFMSVKLAQFITGATVVLAISLFAAA